MKEKQTGIDERHVGINTLAYLFLQVFLDSKTYEVSVMDELRWVVKELAGQNPDAYLANELKKGLLYGHYADSSQDAVFAFAMQRMIELYQLPRQTAKKACIRLQSLLTEAQSDLSMNEIM